MLVKYLKLTVIDLERQICGPANEAGSIAIWGTTKQSNRNFTLGAYLM